MYLVDTNVFLELLLEQEKAEDVEQFLQSVPHDRLHLSDFSLYSIGIRLSREKLLATFRRFVEDMITSGGVTVVRLAVNEMPRVVHFVQRFNLDFDDAYQYASAEKYDLTIVSFDSDFDRTERGRKVPADVLRK